MSVYTIVYISFSFCFLFSVAGAGVLNWREGAWSCSPGPGGAPGAGKPACPPLPPTQWGGHACGTEPGGLGSSPSSALLVVGLGLKS